MNVTMHGLGASGEGVGTLANGLKIFVDGALPGEEVEVALTVQKKNYAKGELLRLITPSPHRIAPICPLFGTCGGCHLMHLDYPEQLIIKRQRIIDALQRIGNLHSLPPVAPCLPSPQPLFYRNKIQLPVAISATTRTIGLYRRGSHEIIDVPRCYIHHGEETYAWIREHLPHSPSIRHLLIRQGVFTHETLVILITDGQEDFRPFAQALMQALPAIVGVVENINIRNTNTILGPTFRPLLGRPYFHESLLGKRFKITPASFFQINSWQAEQLIQTVLNLLQSMPHDTLYDAYTGVGTFALFAADHAKHVLGTECVPQAIACAQENALLNGITNCTFEVGDARAQEADVTLLNPPRKGCLPSILSALTSPHLIYISCDPATLARDLALLPNYAIQSITPLDLFPQTIHVETVVSLTRKRSA